MTWLVRSVFLHWLNRDIESYKTGLHTIAVEQQIKFSRLHNDRAVVIRKLYTKLVRMEKSVYTFMNPFGTENDLPTNEQQKNAFHDAWEFIWYFDDNRIFFVTRVCDIIEQIYKEFKLAWYDFTVYQKYSESSLPRLQSINRNRQNKAFTSIKEKMPELRIQLENEFREMLGVEK